MALMHFGLLVLQFCFACSYQFRGGAGNGLSVQHPEKEWKRMQTLISEEITSAPAATGKLSRSASVSGFSAPAARMLPEYLIVSSSKDPKQDFKPQLGNEPLPHSAVNMLLGSPSNILPIERKLDPSKTVEILCHIDRMYVRIKREVFKTRDAYKYLKLGTCPVNQGTSIHYYLLYLLKSNCGFKQDSKPDYLYISNVLLYKPTSPVLREMPFNIPLQCKYPRSFYSYEVGFYPILQGQTVFKALGLPQSFTLTPQDAMGNEMTIGKSYTMGEPMYFVAKQPENTGSGRQRIYINTCFMTASRDPTSSPKYTVIDNQGCMIDGIVTDQSQFLTSASKTMQKFTVSAFVFKDTVSTSSSQILYMHCEIATGKLTATPSSKACNYDPATKTWKELYGDNSVCACCESSCPSAQPRSSKTMISTRSWNVDTSGEEEYGGVVPRMKPSDTDAFILEDPYLTEHRDFLNYW